MSLDKVDKIDIQILNMLVDDARVSYTEIAKKVDMTPPSIIERVKRLEQKGIIVGYTTKINYRKFDYDITAFIGIGMDNPVHIEDFRKVAKDMSEDIIECYHITGDYTLLLKVITKNTDSLSSIVSRLREFQGITRVYTYLVFSTMLERTHQV